MCFSDVLRYFRITSFHMISFQTCTPFHSSFITPHYSPDGSPPSSPINETTTNAQIQFFLIYYCWEYFSSYLFSNRGFYLKASQCGHRAVQPKNKSSFNLFFHLSRVTLKPSFKITAGQETAQGKPCTNVYVAKVS